MAMAGAYCWVRSRYSILMMLKRSADDFSENFSGASPGFGVQHSSSRS
jgi:hypothetical protein